MCVFHRSPLHKELLYGRSTDFKENYKLIKLSLSKKPKSEFWKDAFEFIQTKIK